jgi:FkbM family methyltransferase
MVTKVGVEMTTYNRGYVEMTGQMGARVIHETSEYKLVRVLNRVDMYVHKSDKSVTPHLEIEGFWESWITTWVLNNVHSDAVFIDVGANTGYYGLLAYDIGASVGFVEPNPDYYNMLRRTVNYNRFDSAVIFPVALGNEDTTMILNVPLELHGSASLHRIAGYETRAVEVPVYKMDTLFGRAINDKPHFLKIDAESAEEMVWDGAQEYLAAVKPTVLMEYTPGAYGRDFLDKLEGYGDLAYINEQGHEQPISKSDIVGHADWLMLVLRPH